MSWTKDSMYTFHYGVAAMNSRFVLGKTQRFARSRSACLAALFGLLALSTWVSGHAQPLQAGPARVKPAVVSEAACPALLQHSFDRLQDEKPQSLCQYGGQVVLVVNTASLCGFTGQYKGLEELFARYRDRGFVVLGFPSGDFGRQELGDNQAIADFCENTFGVRFPMFSKSRVSGAGANPLFRQLAERSGQTPQWNFHKYLIARDGRTVRSFASTVEPQSPTLTRDIERFLSTKQ
nr:glutathione peroxidase [Hydrogenophaga sp.]